MPRKKMQPQLIDIHWCVSPVTGKGKVRKYNQGFCSNHVPMDGKSYGLVIPEDLYEEVKDRLEKENEAI